MESKKFLFVSIDALISDTAWHVLKEGHKVKYFIEDKDEKEIADGFVPKTENWEEEVAWADVIVFDDVLGQGKKAQKLRNEGKLVIGGTPYTDKLEDDRAFGQQELKNAGGEFIVAKNTLVARVVGKEEMNQSFNGQTGTVFSYEDEVSALKALVKFAKENDVVKLKHGLVGTTVYDANALEELSKLPGKTELIGMLLGRLNAPASKLVGVLKASQRDLVYALQAIADKKGN